MEFRPSLDLRYFGQEYTLTVPVRGFLADGGKEKAAEDFHAAYLTRYGHSNPGEAVELVSVRIAAVGLRPPAELPLLPERPAPAPVETAPVYFGDRPRPAGVYQREDLGRGAALSGPAVVLEAGCTTLIPPGWRAEASDRGHLMMERTG